MKKCYVFFLLSSLSNIALSASLSEKNADKSPFISDSSYFNLIFGLSPFVGGLGFEYQKGNHALAIGFPESIAYRYYFNHGRNTKFWGVYYSNWTLEDNNEIKSGVLFQDYETEYFGAGVGYRWQWAAGWNVNTSISFQYLDIKFTNPGSSFSFREKYILPFPGVHVGYKF